MAGKGPGAAHIPWYGTVFRGDDLQAALIDLGAAAGRYGGEVTLHRSTEDAYRFHQTFAFTDKSDWTKFWEGPEASLWRTRHMGIYTQPVMYTWFTDVAGAAVAAPVDEPASVA